MGCQMPALSSLYFFILHIKTLLIKFFFFLVQIVCVCVYTQFRHVLLEKL